LYQVYSANIERKEALKLGRISRKVVHSSLDAYFKIENDLFLFLGVESKLVLRKPHLLFTISLVFRCGENKRMPLQSGLGENVWYI
jgi:hypothetical protein